MLSIKIGVACRNLVSEAGKKNMSRPQMPENVSVKNTLDVFVTAPDLTVFVISDSALQHRPCPIG